MEYEVVMAVCFILLSVLAVIVLASVYDRSGPK